MAVTFTVMSAQITILGEWLAIASPNVRVVARVQAINLPCGIIRKVRLYFVLSSHFEAKAKAPRIDPSN